MRISDWSSDVCSSDLESLSELKLPSEVAVARGTTAPVALRVNPDVDAGTHAKITTGRADTKFGIEAAAARHFLHATRSIPGIRVEGLAVHIGSQLNEISPHPLAFAPLHAVHQELPTRAVP